MREKVTVGRHMCWTVREEVFGFCEGEQPFAEFYMPASNVVSGVLALVLNACTICQKPEWLHDDLLLPPQTLISWDLWTSTRAEFHFSWVYNFSATPRSLRIWATHPPRETGCDPEPPAQLCWSSSSSFPHICATTSWNWTVTKLI